MGLPDPNLPKFEAAPSWHALSVEEVARRLGTDADAGLSSDEARRRLARDGPNRLPEPPRASGLAILARQFQSPVIAVLFVAAILSLALGERADALVIGVVLLLNAALGYAHEKGAERALLALRDLEARTATVRRGGKPEGIPAEDLVPGDLVVLEAGERIPADVRFLRGHTLEAVEAALTGESAFVEKDPAAKTPEDAPISERPTMAYAGTTLVAGVGEALVVATGAGTELGRIVALAGEVKEEPTPLQIELARLGRALIFIALGAVLLIFVEGLVRGVPLARMLPVAVGLAVAAVPEGLPAVVTIALAVAVRRMARRNVLIRQLPAVETLGAASVLCVDKTGTLTTGRMEVTRVATLSSEAAGDQDPAARAAIEAAAAASTASLVGTGSGRAVRGDPMEGALLLAAERVGLALRADRPTAIRPFDTERKRMSVLHATPGGATLYVKGAPETVLPVCARVLSPDGEVPLDDAARERLKERNAALAERGLRVLAVARREGAGAEAEEEDLTFLGFLGLEDPARPDTKPAVEACHGAGIRVVMITGDQSATAFAVARDLGILRERSEVEGAADLAARTEEGFAERAKTAAAYARASPADKLRIVRALRRGGAVVAMTGDGVNDAPALRGADIGVAMGSGTDAAKDVADLVVTDDRFASIVAAVSEGRAVHENVRKSLLYVLSGNLAELLVIGTALLVGWPIPLLPLQLLWINLVTDSLPALALATDPTDEDLLRRPPRPPGSGMTSRGFLKEVVGMGLLTAVVTLAAFAHGLAKGSGSEEYARTLAFTTLVVAEVLRSFVVRSRIRILWELGLASNLRLLLVVLGILAAQAVLTFHADAGRWLDVTTLRFGDVVIVGALALVPATVIEVTKLVRRALGKTATTTE